MGRGQCQRDATSLVKTVVFPSLFISVGRTSSGFPLYTSRSLPMAFRRSLRSCTDSSRNLPRYAPVFFGPYWEGPKNRGSKQYTGTTSSFLFELSLLAAVETISLSVNRRSFRNHRTIRSDAMATAVLHAGLVENACWSLTAGANPPRCNGEKENPRVVWAAKQASSVLTRRRGGDGIVLGETWGRLGCGRALLPLKGSDNTSKASLLSAYQGTKPK
eukprot:3941604-Rhodomonas_salina.4